MNQQLQVFNHEQFGDVRIIEEGGRVLFCGSDVAKALGYTNPRKALHDHCRCVTKRDAWVQTGTKSDGTPAMRLNSTNFIPEGDVYRLITHSKLPAAERFEKWVFDEVLPTIRKTGGYGQQINLEQLTKIIAMTVQATVKELLPYLVQDTQPECQATQLEIIHGQQMCQRSGRTGKSQSKIVAYGFTDVVIEFAKQRRTNREIREYLQAHGLEISEMSICRFRKRYAAEGASLTIVV